MLVETFEVTELNIEEKVKSEEFEQTKELVSQLGLVGQEQFLNNEVKEVFPYRKMLKQEDLVYKALCPQRTELANYADSIIPLRVLQIAAHAQQLGLKKLMVWHSESSDTKDPMLIGEMKGSNFILARWGEVLLPFEELLLKAKSLLTQELKGKIA